MVALEKLRCLPGSGTFYGVNSSFYCLGSKNYFSLHMHAKPLFAHRLQTAKMASSRTSAQNNGPRAQKNGPWV